jgi:hypothetical protein
MESTSEGSRHDRRPVRGGVGRFAPTDATSLAGDPEDTLTHLLRLAIRSLTVSMVYITLRDGERLVLVSQQGLRGVAAARREIPADHSLSLVAMERRAPVFVSDPFNISATPEHELLGAESHAAVPLELPDGEVIGTFCAGARWQHRWTTRDAEMLGDTAAVVVLVLRNRETMHSSHALADLVRRIVGPTHELTDRVRSLTGLLGTNEDARVRLFSALAEQRVRAVDALLAEVPAVTRAAGHRPPGGPQPIDLAELVKRSLASARAAAGTKEAYLDAPHGSVIVECDPLELEESLTALLIALMHYARLEDKLHVRMVSDARVVHLDILKLGPMVPPAEMTRMVARFRFGASPLAHRIRLRGRTVIAAAGALRARSSEGRSGFRLTIDRWQPQATHTS